jgi:putative glutathione S-transferase
MAATRCSASSACRRRTSRASPGMRRTPGFGDTIDFVDIKRHYYIVHREINPTGIVPAGPDLTNWLTPHDRDRLGGRPFGDGTPPPPPKPTETVPPGHGAVPA